MGFPCRIISIWHDAPFVLSKYNLVTSNFTPVVYEGGAGTYNVMGYIGRMTDDYISLIIDNTFTITEGMPPAEGVHVICDAVKDVANKLISDTIAIAKMELKMSGRPSDLEFRIDELPPPETLPEQLVEINRWILKMLIVDYKAIMSDIDPFDPTMYFAEDEAISGITKVVTQWDQFYHLATMALGDIKERVQELESDPQLAPYLDEVRKELVEFGRTVRDVETTVYLAENRCRVKDPHYQEMLKQTIKVNLPAEPDDGGTPNE